MSPSDGLAVARETGATLVGSHRAGIRTAFVYAQDNRGMGHINRTLTIVRHLLAAHPNLVAYIATKSPITSNFTLPKRTDYIKLPTRLTPPTVHPSEEEDAAGIEHFRRIRGQILRDAALGLAPDLVLVDHEPLGTKGEFRDGLYALKAQSPRTRFVFGLRDIMDDASAIRALWRRLGVYDALENLYDGIAVYGSRALYDVAEAYDIAPSVLPKLHYCGYVVRERGAIEAGSLRREYDLPQDGRLVLATVGSGYDGYPVLQAAQQALARLRASHPDLAAILVTGPFMKSEERAALEATADGHCRVLARADTFQLMAIADAVVGMGGYNTVCEALAAGCPLVIVPRSTHKIEQRIRAQILAARGLARCVPPETLGVRSLCEALEWALDSDRRSHGERVRRLIPSFDGAERLTEYLSPWLD